MSDPFYDEEGEKYRLKKQIDAKNAVIITLSTDYIRFLDSKKNVGSQR